MDFVAPEQRINLATLQHKDPFIKAIRANAKHVNLYTYKADANEWEKTDVEGALFVYERSAPPLYGFMILNQHGTNNFVQPIDVNLEFQLQVPFLLYRNHPFIFGIWFYEAKVGRAITDHLQRLVIECREEEVRRKNSLLPAQPASQNTQTTDSITRTTEQSTKQSKGVDILQMLNKAQSQFVEQQSEPQPPPSVPTSYSKNIVRPQPVKAQLSEPGDQSRSITIDDLFMKASERCGKPQVTQQPLTESVEALFRPLPPNRMTTVSELEGEHTPEATSVQLIAPSLLTSGSTISAASTADPGKDTKASTAVNPALLRTTSVDKSELLSPMAFSAARRDSASGQIPVAINPPQTFNVKSSESSVLSGFTSVMQSAVVTPGGHPGDGESTTTSSSLPVSALTREQLRQALQHLLNNNDRFLDDLHTAYIDSLRQSFTR